MSPAAIRHERPPKSDLHSLRFVLLGAIGGTAYAALNTAMDYWHSQGVVARAFVALRARLQHVERHQAVWVVAAATLHEGQPRMFPSSY